MVLGANWNNETDVGKHVTKLFGGGGQLKIGNFLFSLHHRWTMLLILVGLFVISANNYLNEKAITCLGGQDYHNHYCYLHGAAHIPDFLQNALAPKESGRRCTAEGHGDKDRSTSYYIWLPFILTLCAIVTKLPWIVWKNVIERGLMEKLVKDIAADKEDTASKTAKRFYNTALKNKKNCVAGIQATVYNVGFAFCELLNIIAIGLNFHILDTILHGQFSPYGLKANEYFAFRYDQKNDPNNPGPPNPLCSAFPTEVSCSVATGAIAKDTVDVTNMICLLSNNVFNQYFFLVLWWWWVTLLFLSCLGLVYRIAQLAMPQLGRLRLSQTMNLLCVDSVHQKSVDEMTLNPWQLFLLNRLLLNLKGSQATALIPAMVAENGKSEIEENSGRDEKHALVQINTEEK